MHDGGAVAALKAHGAANRLIAAAALRRRESRGGHARVDFPQRVRAVGL